MDVAFVPPTSNECERFFSSVKLVFNDLRQSMDPMTLEAVMCLGINRDLWDAFTVERVRHRMLAINSIINFRLCLFYINISMQYYRALVLTDVGTSSITRQMVTDPWMLAKAMKAIATIAGAGPAREKLPVMLRVPMP
ncbi:hypothetical protein JG688_00010895 [Phytophthora aleatoria]|uniref:HAT C-terminal dimerisation domain-containing protein n=1 Tax=Phytophthora aleatoria TaxID=2496075 RepID=A0A8J5M317_9STRA|nr:hypothetical protein JG688_00010895 [Phytophthora aleatoria]